MPTRWEYFIICLLAILIGIMICSFEEVLTIRRYFEAADNNPNISADFAYMKDFMDRNIEYFSVFTGVTVAVISILVGLVFMFKNDGAINAMRSDFAMLREEQSVRNDNHTESIRALNSDLLGNIGIVFSQIALSYKNSDPIRFIYLNSITLYNFFIILKSSEDDEISQERKDSLRSLIEDCNSALEVVEPNEDETFHFSLQQQAELLSLCPDEFRDSLFKFILAYNSKLNIVKFK